MILNTLLGSLTTSYARGAATGWGRIRAIGVGAGGADIGDFRLAKVFEAESTGAAAIEITNLDAIRAELKDAAPNLYRKLNRDLKKVGVPAQERVQEAFRMIQNPGPLGPPIRRGRKFDRFATSTLGRLSWINSKTLDPKAAVELNFKNRNKARDWSRIQAGKDGTLSIVRVLVKAPAFVVADVAGNSGKGRLSPNALVREYSTNLFGRGVIQATTNMRRFTPARRDAVWQDWIGALDRQRRAPRASRYAWPAVDDHMPQYREDTSRVLNEVIAQINQRMQG